MHRSGNLAKFAAMRQCDDQSSSPQQTSDLNQTLSLKAPGGVENGLSRRSRRPAQHAPSFVRRNQTMLPKFEKPTAYDRIKYRK